MAYNLEKLALLKHLKTLGDKVNTLMSALTGRVKDLEDVGAQANVLESVKVNGTAQAISDKAVDITVPTKVSDLTNDSKFQTQEEVAAAVAAADHLKRKIVESTDAIDLTAADADQYIYMVKRGTSKTGDKYDEYMIIDGELEKVGDWTVDLSGYVEKEEGKGLSSNDYTAAEKEKLAGIAENANNYTHPSYTAHTSGLYKVTVDAAGHVSAAEAVAKEDITGLGVPAQDTTYSPASATADGLMSKEDKAKLDGIEIATDDEVSEMITEIFGAAQA